MHPYYASRIQRNETSGPRLSPVKSALLCHLLTTAAIAFVASLPASAQSAPDASPVPALRGGVGNGPGGMRSSVTTTKTVEAAPTQVDTRTYVKNGKTVTETITTHAVTETVSEIKTYRAAIFVANRAGQKYDDKIRVLEDFVSARVADTGVQVIARETTVDAARAFNPALASTLRPEDSLDTLLANESSALRLAQNLGADYLLQISLGGLSKETRRVKAYGVEVTNDEYSALVTYKILDGLTGAALSGDTVKPVRLEQANAHASADLAAAAILDGLLDDAAQKITAGLQARVADNRIAAPDTVAALATITLIPDVADVFLPEVRLDNTNTVSLSEGKNKVSILNVTVEVDGVVVGTAPGKLQLRRGFSRLRLTREGFKPWERLISAFDSQVIVAPMQMDEAGLKRWKEVSQFVSGLRNGEKLTDAQAEVLRGEAQKLRQSGYKVDIKVDAKELPNVTQKSLL
ncbi:PEGA domain-containing protein [Geminisphaera colitermitum]|uniref:PEGA domain-containing protein n=1 Tax=Geminisphaera colitermitum TaxID=1148786 RepID=UPI000158C96A|nr:PEGA domain-containing protein [Geminisphaera colitermitum]